MQMYVRPFQILGNTANLTVGTSSSNVLIPLGGIGNKSIRVFNSGTNVVFFKLGTGNTTSASASTDTPLLPNSVETFFLQNEVTYIAAIAAGTGNTLYVTPGESA